MSQEKLMEYDPATGADRPYPSHALQWRQFHGPQTAWMFNPWSGLMRDARDVGTDPFGTLVVPPARAEGPSPCQAPAIPEPPAFPWEPVPRARG